MGLIREPAGVDFVIEPHIVTEEDHLSMLAFIAACKDMTFFCYLCTNYYV